MQIKELEVLANRIRKDALDMASYSGRKGSHIGGSFSAIEIFTVLYGYVMNLNKNDWINRDRLIVSKAHCILSYYSVLSEMGFIDKDLLNSYNDNNGFLAGHPQKRDIGLEFSGGSLGMGLSVGLGVCMKLLKSQIKSRVYVLLGDGECNEGSVWESFMAASQFNINNICAIVDYNNMQFDGTNDEIMSLDSLKRKIEAFGWDCKEVDGHSIKDLINVFDLAKASNRPFAIIAKTVKAKGILSLENKAESHHAQLTDKDKEYLLKLISEGYYERD